MARALAGYLILSALLTPPVATAAHTADAPGSRDLDVVSSTGDAALSIPIDVPKGTGGFAPTLELRYSSSNGDGIFGVGWSLALSEIRVTTRFGTPKYDATDRYELDGELLIQGPGGSTEYRMATETFARIQRTGDSWVVNLANGTTALYGTTAETQIRKGGDTNPGDDTGPIARWLLRELTDVNGNSIRFDYDRSIDAGTAYPTTIKYTYRGNNPVGELRTIIFVYEPNPRPDVIVSFAGGVASRISRRVGEIQSSAGTAPYRRRIFRYNEGTYSTGRSRLTSTQVFGTDCGPLADLANCQALPAQTFTYTDPRDTLPDTPPSGQWVADPSITIPVDFTEPQPDGPDKELGIRMGDVDGDGLVDMVRAWDGVNSVVHEVYLRQGAGWVFNQSWSDALAAVHYTARMCQKTAQDSQIFFARDGSHGDPAATDNGFFGTYREGKTGVADALLVDLNADGRVDLIASYLGEWRGACAGKVNSEVWLNTGTEWARDAALSNTLPARFSSVGTFLTTGMPADCAHDQRVIGLEQWQLWYGAPVNCWFIYYYRKGTAFVDLNADGRLDLVSRTAGPYDPRVNITNTDGAWLNTEQGWVAAPAYLPPYAVTAGPLASPTGFAFADLNGDGLTDLVKTAVPAPNTPDYAANAATFEASGVWLNTGSGWCDIAACPDAARFGPPVAFAREFSGPSYPGASPMVVPNGTILADVNGDQLVDLIRADGSDPDPANRRKAWIHNPSANPVWVEDSRFEPPAGMEIQILWSDGSQNRVAGSAVRLEDVDASGTPDFLRANSAADAVLLAEFSIADRLGSYANGNGGSFLLEYASAVEQRDSSLETLAAADAVDLGENTGSGIILWTPRPVVIRLTVSDPYGQVGGDQFDTTFSYAYPKWCPVQRSHLGFRLVVANRPDGSTTRSFFWQDHGRAGRPSRSEVWAGRQRRSVAEEDWVVVDGGSVPGSLPGTDVGRKTAERKSQDYAGGSGATRAVDYQYNDGYGYNFVSGITISRPSGGIVVSRTPQGADVTNWIVGRVATETHASGSITYRSARYFYEPGKGLLNKVERDVWTREATPQVLGTAITEWTYDQYGNVRSEKDPKNRITYFCYDGDSDLGPVGAGGCTATASATHTMLRGLRDPLNQNTLFQADLATGDLRAITRFNGDVASLIADAFGRPLDLYVTPSAQPQARIESRIYVDQPGGGQGTSLERRSYTQAAAGSPYVWSRTYFNGLGRKAAELFPTPTTTAGRAFAWDYAGRPLWESYDAACADASCTNLLPPPGTGSSIPEVNRTYDSLGRLVTETTPDGLSVADYRPATRNSPATGSDGPWDLIIVRDRNGNLLQRILDNDRIVWADECPQPTTQTEPANLSCGSPSQTFYAYEPSGELAQIHDPQSNYSSYESQSPKHQLAYVYDTLGRVLTIKDPDAGVRQTVYDLVGNPLTVTNARGQQSVYTYDALDRLQDINRPDSEWDEHVDYDPATRRRASVTVTNASTYTSYSYSHAYDAFGRESRRVLTTFGLTLIADFEYDLLNRITKVLYPATATAAVYEYQGAYLTRVCEPQNTGATNCAGTNNAEYVSSAEYDNLGRLFKLNNTPGTLTQAYYPLTQRLQRLTFASAAAGTVLDLSYAQYDPNGNVKRIDDLAPAGAVNATADYGYDVRDRLESHNLGGVSRLFNYDVLGNLTGRDVGSATTQNQFYEDPVSPHRLSRVEGGVTTTYEYDADGNLTRRGGQYLGYDSASRLICAGPAPNNCPVYFKYDLDGVLFQELGTGTNFRIRLGDLFEWDTSNNTASSYIFAFGRRIAVKIKPSAALRTAWGPAAWPLPVGPEPLGWLAAALAATAVALLLWWLGAFDLIAKRPAPALVTSVLVIVFLFPPPAFGGGGGGNNPYWYWFQPDHLGSNVVVTNSAGDVIRRRVFEPFGNVFAETGSAPAPQLFTGQRFEPTTGLYDFKARWYDATTGRFLSVDPILQQASDPQQLNGYSYVGNNPINRIDPSGEGFFKDLWEYFFKPLFFFVVIVVVSIVAPEAVPAVASALFLSTLTSGAINASRWASAPGGIHSLATPAGGAPARVEGVDPRADTAESGGDGGIMAGVLVIAREGAKIPHPAAKIAALVLLGLYLTYWAIQVLMQEGNDPQPPQQSGESEGDTPEYEEFEDAIGELGEVSELELEGPTKDEALREKGFTEKWTGRNSAGNWQSAFRNPKTGKWTGGHRSSRRD